MDCKSLIGGASMAVPHKAIFLSAMNPRKDRGDLEGLKESILAHGIIEPLVVRHNGSGHTYELIVGERRLSALNELIAEGFFSEDVTVPVVLREMDDDNAKQMMIVENMMRKDLTELEQAQAFKDYLAGKDGDELHDAVAYLSEKTGLAPRFIRRRIQILALPREVLDMWNNGDLHYGHLEQLMRLSGDQALEKANLVVQQEFSVADLKHYIDSESTELTKALFIKKDTGCPKCNYNSQVQRSLFGSDGYKTEKSMCLNPECFFKHQKEYMEENWDSMEEVKEAGTNGISIFDGNFANLKVFWRGTPEGCSECEHFVTSMYPDGTVRAEHVCKGEKTCFEAKTAQKGMMTQAVGLPTSSPITSDEASAAKAESRAKNHGIEFSDIFFQTELPKKIEATDSYNVNRMRVALLALVRTVDMRAINNIRDGLSREALIDLIFYMEEAEINSWLAKLSAEIVTCSNNFSMPQRINMAEQFDLKLDRDFVMTKEYLNKKTKAELIRLNAHFNNILGETDKALSEYKKTALVQMFLNQDLAGKIPPEIVDIAQGKNDIVSLVNRVFERTTEVCANSSDCQVNDGCNDEYGEEENDICCFQDEIL